MSDAGSIPEVRISNMRDLNSPNDEIVTDLRIDFAEMSRDLVHLSSCFQELSAQIAEFMNKQEQRVADIQSTCITRSAKWSDNDRRLNNIETNQRDLYKRVECIEKVHTEEEGGKVAVRPIKDYFMYVFMTATSVAEGAIILFLLAKLGLL
jgi:hypothetical protein